MLVRHNKTRGVYHVIAVGVLEGNLEPVVVYKGTGGQVWVRTLDNFCTPGRFSSLNQDSIPYASEYDRQRLLSKLI